MSESKHIRGTWERKDRDWLGGHRREIFVGGRHIASVHAAHGVWDRNEANANVISAAPELLAALEKMADEVGRQYGETAYDLYPDVFAAIAKARGEST